MEHLPEGDICPHAFDEASFKVPRHNDKVCHEECAYCCDTTLHPGGIFVCAKCFVGVCPRHIEKHLSLEPTHTTYVRIESTIQYPEKEPTITDATQLGVVPPKEDKVRCYCGECGVHFALSPEFDIAASASAKAIVNADAPTNDAQDGALAAWGLDSPCSCCNDSLKQLPHDKFGPTSENNGKVAPTESEKCNNCECNKNCWFCLTCGNIGCPRKEAGGQEHGIFHFMMTGHPLVLKLGTVTPKRADIHCYKCEREIGYYPELPKHLAHFGIQMSTAVKTAKSLAEMEVDRSLKNEYDSIQEADCVLEPCFGPGTTGLTNFGNTCYIASILQVLNATVPFAKNFGTERGHIAQCKRSQPLNCIECQAERLFVGMASGKYSIPPPSSVSEDDTPAENFREKRTREDRNAIAPKLWKQLVAGNNADWKSKDQQDAEEYFNWVMNMLREVKLNPPLDDDDKNNQDLSNEDSASKSSKQVTHPARVFEFLEETRRSCGACGAARYSYTPYQTLAMHLPVENPPPPLNPDEKLSPEEMEARRVPVEFSQMAASYLKENTYEGTCSHCKAKSTFTNTQKIATFPDFIAIKARREFYDVKLNQVRKMDAKVMMPEKLDLSQFAGTGFQAGKETWLSEEISSSSRRPAAASSNQQQASCGVVVDEEQLANLVAMDFDRDKCRWALFKCKNDPEVAISYIFDHPDEPSESDLRSMEHVPATPPAPAPPTDERDNHDNAASSAVGGKDSPISIPKEKVGTDGVPSNYELYAMVSHMGKNAHSGHWIAHVKDPERGWIIFNDEKVAFSKKTPFTHGSIYFYRRV